MNTPKIMTIAGSDSGGGAGIQADLKTIAALGGYGTSVITALTAQNTRTVTAIHEIPPKMIEDQFEAVMEDIGADAVKIGMLSNPATIRIVGDLLGRYAVPHIVLDPVMVSKSGAQLLQESAVHALREHLLPRCTLLTPNIPEAEKLAGFSIETDEEIEKAAGKLNAMGVRASLIKGGHLNRSEIMNTLFDGSSFYRYTAERQDRKFTHGTGCTLSSAIAAYLARGLSLAEAVGNGIDFVSSGIKNAYEIGSGTNPLNHMYMFRSTDS